MSAGLSAAATRTTAGEAIKTDAKWGLESTAKLTVLETNVAIGRLPAIVTSKSAAGATTAERRGGSPARIGQPVA